VCCRPGCDAAAIYYKVGKRFVLLCAVHSQRAGLCGSCGLPMSDEARSNGAVMCGPCLRELSRDDDERDDRLAGCSDEDEEEYEPDPLDVGEDGTVEIP
jgi:predicted amidophosphoribosyltransferase